MLLAAVLYCWVPCYLGITFCPSIVKDLFLELQKIFLFLNMAVPFHYKKPLVYSWLCSCSCCIGFGKCCSMSIHIFVKQCSWHSLCPRFTGVVPATYAGPGQLGFEGLPCGQYAWVTQEVNKSLRVEPLLTFKHLFQQYFIISTAHRTTHQTSDSGRTPLKQNEIIKSISRNDNISIYNIVLPSMCNIIIIIIKISLNSINSHYV